MPGLKSDFSSTVNHVFVDFENVQQIDLAVIGSKAVNFTLLVGPRQTKLDMALAEKLFEYANSVQLVRLTSAGRNALDFAVAYYLGRAVLADPTGYFHIVSKDAGYDPLIEHLRSQHIRARRHDDFSSLTFTAPVTPIAAAVPATPVTPLAPAVKPKSSAKPKTPPSPPVDADGREQRVLEHFRKPSANRPRTRTKLVKFVIAHLGRPQITEAEALDLVEHISQSGHLAVDAKGKLTYHL
jgi:hypothetical protein